MSILDPNWQPGKDWTHRIDAIPQPRRMVKIKLRGPAATELEAVTCPAATPRELMFKGIGCEIAYNANGLRYRADEIAEWRYR